MLSDVAGDARFALRKLRAKPGLAAAAIATLALGIGAPTAMFSVVSGVLLRPLPYPEPDRIVRFELHDGPIAIDAIPAAMAAEWTTTSRALQALALFNDRALTLTTGTGPYRLSGASATPNMFRLLGVAPAIGRTFTDDPGGADAREIVLSDACWRTYFGSDPAALERTTLFDGVPYRIVGVMPASFTYPTPEAAFWVPQDLAAGGGRGLLLPAIARLAAGASAADAVTEANRLLAGPEGTRRATVAAQTLKDQMVGGVRRLLWLLMAAVTVVFLIATVNIALLRLTDGHARQREFAVRLAIGAPRRRLVRQLLAEGGVLAIGGGIAGVAVAALFIRLFVHLAPLTMPRLQDVSLDGRVVAFAAVAALIATALFSVLSAGRAVAFDVLAVLGGATESRLVTPRATRWRLRGLAAAGLALAMVLLAAAALLLHAFATLASVPPGFDSRAALAAQISMPAARYPGLASRMIFLDQLLERLRGINGVRVAGVATAMPNRPPTGRFRITAERADDPPDPFSNQIVDVRMVTEGFLDALGATVVDGRLFRAGDTMGGESAIVLSQSLARQLFPGTSAVGRTVYCSDVVRRVVGVVGDIRPASAAVKPAPAAYLPLRQIDMPQAMDWWSTATLVLRGQAPPSAETVRRVVLALDPSMPSFNVRTLDDEVSSQVAEPRFNAMWTGAFGAAALLLAAIGVYGVMAHVAALRTPEIALRLALGATPVAMVQLVLREGAAIVGVGIVAGAAASWGLAGALRGRMPDWPAASAAPIAVVAGVLAAVGLVAALLPALRAARTRALSAMRA